MKLSTAERLNYGQLIGMPSAQSRTRSSAQVSAIAEDALLMRRAAQGDQSAWRKIVETHLPAMNGLAFRMSLQDAAAEDVTQEAFLRLWKVAPTWKPDAQISTWLYRVVRNLAIDAIRRRKTAAAEELEDDIQSSDPTPLQSLSINRGRAQISEAIKQLPERQRAAIILVHFGECSGTQAAEELKVSIDALESLLARGRRRLRKILSEKDV